MIIDVEDVSKNYGYGVLFEHVSFSLGEGDVLSIVGFNGCGKSTLLKIISKEETKDSGIISIKKNATIGYLHQVESSISTDALVYDILYGVFDELITIKKKITKLEGLINDGDESKVLEYCNLLDKYNNLGGYQIDAKISKVVDGLGIDVNILNQKYNTLSGGEKTLVGLAKILLLEPDLLLLDEPTNHLDIARIEWLEEYIKTFKGAIIIVSHDRYFLDKMSNKILDLSDITPTIYNTNYTGYLEEKEKNYNIQMAKYKDEQDMIKRLENERKYFAERGMATNSTTLTSRAKALQTRIDKIKANSIKKPVVNKSINLNVIKDNKTSKDIVVISDLSVSIDNHIILDNISLSIKSKEKVALIGANGSGKTTLLSIIMNTNTLSYSGSALVGPSVKIGYLPQVIVFKDDKKKVIDYFRSEVGLDIDSAMRILMGYNFSYEDQSKSVKNLSGGEKVRLKLAIILQEKINTLILDEPTNNLDIPTREVLEEALMDFDGTLIFVSHDRYFINKFASKIYEFSNGLVTTYLGNYEDYKKIKDNT